MLADRPYMRDPGYRPPQPLAIKLLIALTAIFAVQCIDDVYLKSNAQGYLALTPLWLKGGYLWQLLTFQVLHHDLFHLLCNGIGLWFIGRYVETILGPRRFLLAFFGCGLLGGLLQGTLMVLFPGHYGSFVFGASAGVSGIFAIFARLLSHEEVRFNFILPIRAGTLLWIFFGIELFFTLVPTPRSGVAHAAHLGGILGGLWFVHLGWHRDFQTLPWDGIGRRLKSLFARQTFIRPVPGGGTSVRPGKSASPAPEMDDDFIASQVDPILDKISSKGLHSLTEQERQILEKARKRMGK